MTWVSPWLLCIQPTKELSVCQGDNRVIILLVLFVDATARCDDSLVGGFLESDVLEWGFSLTEKAMCCDK